MSRVPGHVTCMSILVSIVVSIPACHAGDRGSIPRRGGQSLLFSCLTRRCVFVGWDVLYSHLDRPTISLEYRGTPLAFCIALSLITMLLTFYNSVIPCWHYCEYSCSRLGVPLASVLKTFLSCLSPCIGGSVVEFSPATREARVRFPANARNLFLNL